MVESSEVLMTVFDAATGQTRTVSVLDPVDDTAAVTDLISLAAALRWRKETGGIELGGMAIATDDRSKLMLSGARIAAMADPELVTRWKTPSGWVDLTAAQIIAISDAVQEHVAECFALEADVSDQIEAGTITTIEEVDSAFSAAE